MPYEGEFAQHRSLRRLAENERVLELLGRFRVQERFSEPSYLNTVSTSDLDQSDEFPAWVLAVDGSHLEVQVQNGYPQAEASYVTVASVLIDVNRIRELDRQRPVDPREFRKVELPDSIDSALPSCNVVFEGDHSAKESLRRALFDVFKSKELTSDGESLLETYEALLSYKPDYREQRCPLDDCPVAGTYTRGVGHYLCECHQQRSLYSTDALRIHEGMSLEGTNGAMFAEVMQVWERIWIVHCLRVFESKKWLPLLGQMAIVLDGPLAVFGHPAWLSQAIQAELRRINQLVRRATGGQDLLLLGVEKAGHFAQHFESLDREKDGNGGRISSQTAVLLDDPYIKRHIIFSDSDKPYGQDTYFGRKFFYKTRSGAKVVGSVPFLDEHHLNMSTAEPNQFPRLGDALKLIDELVSSRYPNAITPLVAAHAEAAIPLNLGTRVLERLARDLIAQSAE